MVGTKINMGRVGVALRGHSGTTVLCWPHANEIKDQSGVHLFTIKQGMRQCGICAELKKKEDESNGH